MGLRDYGGLRTVLRILIDCILRDLASSIASILNIKQNFRLVQFRFFFLANGPRTWDDKQRINLEQPKHVSMFPEREI